MRGSTYAAAAVALAAGVSAAPQNIDVKVKVTSIIRLIIEPEV